MMYCVYALRHPKTSLLYIGYTDNLERRLKEHQRDKLGWIFIYSESYLSKRDAQIREKQLKHYGSSLGHLRKRIKNSIKESF